MNEEILLQVEQVEKVPRGAQGAHGARDAQVPNAGGGNDVSVVPPEMSNVEIREAFLTLARALTTHVNRGIEPRVNVVDSTMT